MNLPSPVRFCAMLFSLFSSGVQASAINLSGTIYDKDNKPMAGVIVSLAFGNLKDTTGGDGKWSLVGGTATRLAQRILQPMAKWSGNQLHLDLTAPALVEMDAFDVRGARLGRVAQLTVDAGSHEIPVTSATTSRSSHWLLLTVDGKRQVLSSGGRVKLTQQPLPGALGRAMADTVEQIIYTLQGQLISADTVRNLIQSGLEKWVQEFSVSGNVLSDPGVAVDSVFAWFDGGRMTSMRRARLGYNKANLAYSGRIYTVKSFTDVYNFRIWLNVTGNGNRKTGVSDTTDFSSEFGDINFIPKFNIANAIPGGSISGSVTGLVNTSFEYAIQLTRSDEIIAHTEWNLGDGSGYRSGSLKQAGKWLQPGTYNVQVRLTDIDSNTTILTKTVNISNQPAVVSGIRDTTITPSDVIVFSVNAVDVDGVAKVIWSFGDGGKDSTYGGPTHTVSHKYPGPDTVKPGESRAYPLTLRVIDSLGNSSEQTASITVLNDIPSVTVHDSASSLDSMIILRTVSVDRGGIVKIEWSTDGATFKAGGKDTTVKIPSDSTKVSLYFVRGIDEDGSVSKLDSITIGKVCAPTFNHGTGTYDTVPLVRLTSVSAGALIYYTTDGTVPTAISSLYVAPISVISSETIKAIAIVHGMALSTISTASYTRYVAPPIFSPGGGTYETVPSISIFSPTPDAQIYYTTDGTTPTTHSALYTTPITVSSGRIVKAMAVVSGIPNSQVSSATYVVGTVSAPVFNPVSGPYTGTQWVTLSCSTVNASIFYTIDGSEPNLGSTMYAGVIPVSASDTIKAYATFFGMAPSSVSYGRYVITAAAPVFSIKSGTFMTTQSLTLSSSTPRAEIYYTNNGTVATAASTKYVGAISVSYDQTIRAIAIAEGTLNSDVVSETYVIGTASAPTFSPGTGDFIGTQNVSIVSSTPGASVFYTLDGSTPTTASTIFNAPIPVNWDVTIKAFATVPGMTNSAISSAAYTITALSPTFSPGGGVYPNAQNVVLTTTTPNAKIYYSTDGTTPTTGSTLYYGPIAVNVGQTIKAIATASGSANSLVSSEAYTIVSP